MTKKINPKVKKRCVQQMLAHVAEYPNPTWAAQVVAKRNGVVVESVHLWYPQARINGSQHREATTQKFAEITHLKVKVHRLEDDNDILRRATVVFVEELDPRDR